MTRPKAPRWLRRIMTVIPLGLLLALTLCPSVLDGSKERAAEEQTELATPAPSGVRAATEDLITAHGCWTGEAPADMVGKWPGGAVIRKPNGVVSYTERPGLIDKALRQAIAGEDTGVWAVAFCRGGQ